VSRFSPPSPHVTITTKFEVHTTIYYVVLAFLLLKRCDLVTLTFDLLTVNSDHEWQVMLLSHPPRLKTLMPVRSWVMRSSICYHWQCVCSHCECRVCERIVPFVLATFLLLLHRNSCIGASDKNSNTAFDSLIPISLYRAILRRFKDVDFTWFFHRVSWKSATFLFPVNLAYWPRKCRTFRPHVTIVTKFEVDTTICYLVLAFFAAETLCDLVTLTFDLLTVNSGPPRLKTLMSVRSWVMRSSICYHWQCVCSHCECRVNPRLRFVFQYATCMALRFTVMTNRYTYLPKYSTYLC